MTIEQRAEARTQTVLEGIVTVNAERISCRLKDISASGAKINSVSPLMAGVEISLSIKPFGSIKGVVAWSSKNDAGIKFTDTPEKIEPVLLGLASYAAV